MSGWLSPLLYQVLTPHGAPRPSLRGYNVGMSSLLSVRPDVARAVIAEARRLGVPPQALLDDILTRGLPAAPPDRTAAPPDVDGRDVDATLARLAARPAPRSADDLRPRLDPPPGSNGLEHVLGRWPGDEDDAALTAALAAGE